MDHSSGSGRFLSQGLDPGRWVGPSHPPALLSRATGRRLLREGAPPAPSCPFLPSLDSCPPELSRALTSPSAPVSPSPADCDLPQRLGGLGPAGCRAPGSCCFPIWLTWCWELVCSGRWRVARPGTPAAASRATSGSCYTTTRVWMARR